MLTYEQTSEVFKCYEDASYFIENYFKVPHPKRGMIAFNLYPSQVDLIKHLTNDESFLNLASRQVGQTNIICAYALWSMIFERKSIAIITGNRIELLEIFKIIRIAFNALPDFLKPAVEKNNRTTLILKYGGRLLGAISSETVIRGMSLDTILVTNTSHLSKKQFEYVWDIALPALSSRIGKVVFTSSGKVHGSDFDRMWNDPEFNFPKFLMAWDSIPLRDDFFKQTMIEKLGEDAWYREFEVS